MEVVSALRLALADKIGEQRFNLWFGRGTKISLGDRSLRIAVPNKFTLDWLRTQFRAEIDAACAEVLGSDTALEFRVDEAAAEPAEKASANRAGQTHASQIPSHAGGIRLAACGEPERAAHLAASPRQLAPETSRESAGEPSEQRLARRRFEHLESFVIGDSNRLAHASAKMVTQRPGEVSPLYIYGPSGVGKTHLLEGIWSAVRRAERAPRLLYLSAEQFTSYFLEALHGSGLPMFRRKYRGLSLMIIDDVQFFQGKRATVVELRHTVDTLIRNGRQVVLAGDRPVAELKGLGDELVMRISAGLVCEVNRPDPATRLGIVRRMAQRLHVEAPDDVLRWIATRVEADARMYSGALNRLRATSEAIGRPITLGMTEEALGEMVRPGEKAVRLQDIEQAVCEMFEIEPKQLRGEGRSARTSGPRMLAMWLARRHTSAALSEISQFFGRRSHSTVISAQKKVDHWVQAQSEVAIAGRKWQLPQTLQKLESGLKAG